MEKVIERQPFSEIPIALLWEILGRVPIKTCLTCKFVCKEWNHIVTSPEFSYFRRHCNASRFALLFHNVWTDGEGLVFNLVEIDKELDVADSQKCVVGIDMSKNISGQFKILILLLDMSKNLQHAVIQTLGNDEWRSVGNAPLKIRADGCFLNGSSHWLDHKYIWSFHFGEEKFSHMPLPDDVITHAYKKKNIVLSVYDSCLCLCCFSEGDCVKGDTWIMKKYGVKESWVKHMQKGGKILLKSEYELYLYDLQTRVSKRVEFEVNELSGPMLRIAPFDASFSRF